LIGVPFLPPFAAGQCFVPPFLFPSAPPSPFLSVLRRTTLAGPKRPFFSSSTSPSRPPLGTLQKGPSRTPLLQIRFSAFFLSSLALYLSPWCSSFFMDAALLFLTLPLCRYPCRGRSPLSGRVSPALQARWSPVPDFPPSRRPWNTGGLTMKKRYTVPLQSLLFTLASLFERCREIFLVFPLASLCDGHICFSGKRRASLIRFFFFHFVR